MGQKAHSPRLLSGRYELGDKLGAGGFGAVYEARDVQLQRTVAIKLFDPKQSGSEVEERFRREAVATAAIQHPNVVTVYDVGLADDRIYIVMELLTGRPLTKELERWPHGMPPARALPLLVGTLEGLAVGHQAGIVHKDLKPSNLFLTRPGEATERLAIIDFGVARVLHEQKLTATGKLVGTSRYLAPEYINDLLVTPALDVYQMGLITVELLCGMPCLPRKLNLVSCCQRHVDGELEIPDGLRTGAIGEVLARATAVDPEDRYPTADLFAIALAEVNPDDVTITTASGHIPTPRLGIKPLTKPAMNAKQPNREVRKVERSSSLSTSAPSQRSTRTGPTKRLGPAKEIVAQLQRLNLEDEVDTDPMLSDNEADERPDPVFVEDAQPEVVSMRSESSLDSITEAVDDPVAGQRRAIYVLVFLAAVAAMGTALFFATQFVV